MKILREAEITKLAFAPSRTRNAQVYILAGQLNVGEALHLTRTDWVSKNQPNLNQNTLFKSTGRTFQCRRLVDGGYVVTRVS